MYDGFFKPGKECEIRSPSVFSRIAALIYSAMHRLENVKRPEPTVRPPSRYLNSIFCGIFYAFHLLVSRLA